MNRTSWWWTLLLLPACGPGTGERVDLYASGTVQRVVSAPDRHGAGLTREYYPNGALESRFRWRNGQKDGLTEHFYPTGAREELTEWRAGQAQGRYQRFHPNGRLQRASHVRNGREVGTVRVYRASGALESQRVYDAQGRLVWAAQYRPDGSQAGSALFPLVAGHADTLVVGEALRVAVRFGYPLHGRVTMQVGTGSAPGIFRDAFLPVGPGADGAFVAAWTPTRAGPGRLWAVFAHTPARGDTLSVDGLFHEFRYYVKAPASQPAP